MSTIKSSSENLTLNADGVGSDVVIQNNGTETVRVDGSGNLKFNSGYGSVATAYGCRAWVSFNGTNGTINASGNVSSVTDNGTGNFTANFTTAMPDANYAVGYAGFESGSTGARLFRADASKTASSLQCLIRTTGSSALRDCDEFTFSIFR